MRTSLALAAAILPLLAGAPSALADTNATLSPTTAFAAGDRQIGSGTSGTRTYTVTGTGTDPVTIQSVALTDPAFTITAGTCVAGKLLAKNETCTVTVGFTPTATGARTANLKLVTSGPTLTSAALTGTGRDLGVSVSALSFSGKVGAGAGTAQTVTVTNRDTSAYTLGAVTVSAQFSKTADGCGATALAGGGSCTISVAFAPTSPGAKSGAIALAGYAPAPVTLSGEARQSATSLSPSTLVFGDSAPRVLTLTSSGVGPLAVGGVTVTGADAASFAIVRDGCSGTSVAQGRSCEVAVSFAPSAIGYRRAGLSVSTDAAGFPLVARLEGRGPGAGADTAADGSLPLARLEGDGGDRVGGALASGPCDVDGDGYDDVISGSQWSRTPVTNSWEGAAYISWGRPGFGGEDLAALGHSTRLEGSSPGAFAGTTGVGCADVNGDGLDDVLVGAWAYEYPGRPSGTAASRGRAYVVFGAKDLRERKTLDLDALGTAGFAVEGGDSAEYDHLGYAVTGVGDLDGDGREDFAVMANVGDTTDVSPARTNNGIVWIVPGQAGTARVDLTKPSAYLARIDGASPGTSASPFGQMIGLAGLGDVNGDGVGDIGIGAYTATAFGRSTASGAAFAISGKTRGRVDLANSSSYLFAIGGAFAGHRLGISIDAAGDVNGDGVDDLITGADSTAAANLDAAYVIYGSRTRLVGTLLDSAALGADGFRIAGENGNSAGFAVAGVGDVNADGHPDLAVGAYAADPPAGASTGSAWIVYGSAAPTDVTLGSLTPAQGIELDGQTAGERFSRALARVGDVDGNGAPDIAFGSDFAVRSGRLDTGEVTVALPAGPPTAPYFLAPAAIPAPTPIAPVVRVNPAFPALAARILRLDSRGRAVFGVRCTRFTTRCRGTLTLRYAGKKLATVKFDSAKTLRVTLPSRLRKRTLHATAVLAVSADGYAGTNTRTLKITIRPHR